MRLSDLAGMIYRATGWEQSWEERDEEFHRRYISAVAAALLHEEADISGYEEEIGHPCFWPLVTLARLMAEAWLEEKHAPLA